MIDEITDAGNFEQPSDLVSEVKTDINQVALEVVAGRWGRGVVRNKKLRAAGHDPKQVNEEVNKIFKNRS